MVVMLAAHRITGVAPLAVIFDAAAPGSGVAQPLTGNQYNLQDYRWNFGHVFGSSGSHLTGKSKDTAKGYIAAHVYDQAGSYTATLQMTREDGTVFNYTQAITVTAPNSVYPPAETFYVSNATGNDLDDGLTPGTAFQTFSKAMTVLLASDGPRRVLFNRGESWTVTTAVSTITKTGPFLIGAYGSGNDPILNVTYAGAVWFSLAASVTDLRMVDLSLVGTSATTIGIVPGANNLIYGCYLSGFEIGVQPFSAAASGTVVSSCSFKSIAEHGIWASNGVDVTALEKFAVLNTDFLSMAAGTGITSYTSRTAIQGNRFRDTGATQLSILGLSAPLKTQLICVTDNEFFSYAGSPETTIFGPEDTTGPKYVENVLIEGNLYGIGEESAPLDYFIKVWADKVSIRNNIFNHTNGDAGETIEVDRRGINNPFPLDVRVENNTIFNGSPTAPWTAVTATNAANSVQVTNNVIYSVGEVVTVLTGNAIGLTNLVVDPLFVDAIGGDFNLQETSDGIDTGTYLPHIIYDFNNHPRPSGLQILWDIGALEYQTGTPIGISGSPQIIIIPEIVNLQGALEIVQGSDYFLELSIKDVDGGVVDLTTVTVSIHIFCQFRNVSLQGAGTSTANCPIPLIYKVPTPGGGASPGKIWLHIQKTETETLPTQLLNGVWDLEMIYFGYKYRVFQGAWTIDNKQVGTRYSA